VEESACISVTFRRIYVRDGDLSLSQPQIDQPNPVTATSVPFPDNGAWYRNRLERTDQPLTSHHEDTLSHFLDSLAPHY
jgi:hypothetical protein